MNILYHHRTRATDAQGIHIFEIAQAMRDLGHSVEMASLTAGHAAPAEPAGTPQHGGLRERLFLSELIQLGYNLAGLPYLLWKIHRGRIDLIYERYSLFNFAGVLAARLSGRPLILEVNSPLALEESRARASGTIPLAYWSERLICNLASKVLVVSSPLRRMLVANGVQDEKLMVIPNGVNPVAFSHRKGPGRLRESLGLAGKTVIGFVGWCKTWHRVDLLIAAFDEQKLWDRGAVLLIVGDGPAMPELLALTHRRNLAESVRFAGAIPHDEIPQYVDLIDIAVQPAANEYCCPMKILEYMALGKAIVAPRQENVQELLRPGEARFFAPGSAAELGAAMLSLVEDAEARAEMAENGQRAIRDRGFLWSRNAERVLSEVSLRDRSGKQFPVARHHAGKRILAPAEGEIVKTSGATEPGVGGPLV